MLKAFIACIGNCLGLGALIVALSTIFKSDAIFNLFFFSVFLGIIPAMIAHYKGYNIFLWHVFGTISFVLAFIAILIARDKKAQRG